MKGVVKWFNTQKGYGFIIYDNKEIYVHYSQILNKGFKTLSNNEIVEIGNIVKTENGYIAQAVNKINCL